jgi:8-oxo-dGTP pyrophosphatase MutT (NUDIX family)
MKDPKQLTPWAVKSSRYVFRDRWINVRADDCITGEGVSIAPYYVLEYPDWVHIVALDEENRLLMIRQYRHGSGKVSLELPCGFIDSKDVSSEAAARRELLEETGFSGSFDLVGRYSPNPATHNNSIYIYSARNIIALQEAINDPSEVVQLEFVTMRELRQLLETSAIDQALHVSSIFVALRAFGLLHELDSDGK